MDAVNVESDRPDAAEAKTRIRERGVRICREEQERALQRLRDRRELSEREAAVVRSLAESITDQLLAVPEAHLDAVAADEADPEHTAVALALFGDSDSQ
jgi:glutamyl-tRNA reductase